jgi:hypothetical protein
MFVCLQRINTLAQVQQAKLAKVDMDYVLGVGGFDLEKWVFRLFTTVHLVCQSHDNYKVFMRFCF